MSNLIEVPDDLAVKATDSWSSRLAPETFNWELAWQQTLDNQLTKLFAAPEPLPVPKALTLEEINKLVNSIQQNKPVFVTEHVKPTEQDWWAAREQPRDISKLDEIRVQMIILALRSELYTQCYGAEVLPTAEGVKHCFWGVAKDSTAKGHLPLTGSDMLLSALSNYVVYDAVTPFRGWSFVQLNDHNQLTFDQLADVLEAMLTGDKKDWIVDKGWKVTTLKVL